MALNSPITIDVSEATAKADEVRMLFGEEVARKITYRALGAAAKKVKGIVGQESAKYYMTTKAEARKAVQSYKLRYGSVEGADILASCTIPIVGMRGTVGGRFKAIGGTRRVKRGTKQKIFVRVLRSGRSLLPANISNSQSNGQPPFRLHEGGPVYVRKRKGHDSPVVRVVALATPQFPANRAEGDVRKELLKIMSEKFDYFMGLELGGHK